MLAIYPTARGFGFVILEGRRRTIDWGANEARGDKNRVVVADNGWAADHSPRSPSITGGAEARKAWASNSLLAAAWRRYATYR